MAAIQSWMVCSNIYGLATWMKDGWMGGGSGMVGSFCFSGSLALSKESLLALDSCIFEDFLAGRSD